MIRIAPELVRAIRAHAERDYPGECCGALLGRAGAGPAPGVTKWVLALEPAENRREAEDAPRRFLITADDYRAIERVAREKSLDVLGFYHSHPDQPARPSEYDREHALPSYSYVIVSVRQGRAEEFTSWTLDDDRRAFSSEPVAEITSASR
jgi:proteasome lid subunit RPN8/RPN11